MKKIVSMIRREIIGMKAMFISNIVVSILASISYLGLTFAIQQIMSVANGESQNSLSFVSVIAIIMLIYYAAMNIFSEIVSSKFEISLEKNMRLHQITTLFYKSFLSVERFHSGALFNRLTEDVRLVASFIVSISNQFILETLTAILAILYMFLLN
ncbi:ABC transporter ATP-binding protein [Scatolibacter rhodanostii]|uniref:ABC transporter ATP-binding protein n=1 Tax=Scatolibacter rhodanostii TaxID=2014781 RepID=UPI000C070636|nr:ABC transporter ATP-binding protein [Scatolibacter rhodanostii]